MSLRPNQRPTEPDLSAKLLARDAGRLRAQAAATRENFLQAARARFDARVASVPATSIPSELPISQQVETIKALIARHQVLVVEGATGSGKSTQLPKIALAAGRGVRGWIGCTQPRRIAAKSVARRVAQELQVSFGGAVGYQVRFTEAVPEESLIKFMTDGILLAEIAKDRLLLGYDTLIIDEAHERSLNIDFLLGYLKQLLPKRPDLKVIITSATIDTKRFSEHFASAPVVSVEGRSYPVEIRYAPPQTDAHGDLPELAEQIADQVAALNKLDPMADILVFLPGEREIRETHQLLERRKFAHTEVRALYARLSLAEQDRVFAPGSLRRIVLATNVAETSITVPRIRFVIDSGSARVARYSVRAKVMRLHIEGISKAAANQRAGRCGRLGPGVCVRLYDEADFQARADYTDPEIMRSSLAGVLLTMAKLKLGDPYRFPFLDPPGDRAINDGFQLLAELNAVDGKRQLTEVGLAMAHWPIDVRLSRLLVAAAGAGALQEMLIIASAMAIADVRERPLDKRALADAAHAKFKDERSDFVGLLKLFEAFEYQRQELSRNKFKQWADSEFLSALRLNEWRELHRQLLTQARALKLAINSDPASYEQLHQAMLSAYVTQVGMRDDKGQYRSTRSRAFQIFPSSGLARSKHAWVMAAQLMDTERLWATWAAKIDPAWIEPAAAHLSKARHYDPHWDASGARAVCFQDINLLGLKLVEKRRVALAPVDPSECRALFIRHALVRGEIKPHHRLLKQHVALRAQAERKEEKLRKRGLKRGDDELAEWFEQRLPKGICTWPELKQAIERDQALEQSLHLSLEVLIKPDAASETQGFPDTLPGPLKLPLHYHFDPTREDDGVTVTVRLEQLKRLDARALEWLVPGLLKDKAAALIKSLPKVLRRHFVPAPDFAQAFVEAVEAAPESKSASGLVAALAAFLSRIGGLEVAAEHFDLSELSKHLSIRIRLIEGDGRELRSSRSLSSLLDEFGARADQAFAESAEADFKRDGLLTWPMPMPELPEAISRRDGSTCYPALVDQGEAVGLRIFANVREARLAHGPAVQRLLQIHLRDELRYFRKHIGLSRRSELNAATFVDVEALKADILDAAFAQSLPELSELRSQVAFSALCVDIRKRLGGELQARVQLIEPILLSYGHLRARMQAPLVGLASGNLDDARSHLERLVGPDLGGVEPQLLKHYPRYLKALELRLSRMFNDPARDQARMLEAQPLERAFVQREPKLSAPQRLHLCQLLEEFRVSLFAQELGTAEPVSAKRIAKAMEEAPSA